MRLAPFLPAAAIVVAAAFAAAPARPARADEAPARSDKATCAAVLAAARAIGTAPQYRSVLTATWPGRRRPVEREDVVIGDLIYSNAPGAGRWVKLPMTPADRERLAAGLVRYPPHHCEAAEGVEVVDGVPVRAYAYRQDVSGPDSAANRLWVGERDGLPRRFESQEGTTRVVVTLQYEDVKPPNIR